MSPEFHRPLRLDRIGPDGMEYDATASEEECRALAERLRIPAVRTLTCQFKLRRLSDGIVAASGQLRARVTRICVVTLDEFDVDVAEDFTVHFVPAGSESSEIDPESEDEIPYAGEVIDLGEAAAEQLALGLDPYPRRPGAALQAGAADQAHHPFAGLDGLQRRH